MKRPGFVIIAIVVALSTSSLYTQPMLDAAAARQQRPLPQQLVDRAAAEGRVRVIVGLDVAMRLEARLDAEQRAQQRAAIVEAQSAVLRDLAGVPLGQVKTFTVIPGLSLEVDLPTLDFLARHPRVAYIEEDALSAPDLTESADIVGAPAVWSGGATGAGRAVAVLDTGVDRNHPFFGGRVVAEACFSTTSGGSTAICTPYGSTSTGAAQPCDGLCNHGSHVAGIAAGSGLLSGTTMHGVARGASIIAVQVFSRFTGASCGGASACVLSYVSDQVEALEHVFSLRETYSIASVNMSLGGGRYYTQDNCDSVQATRKAIIDQLRAADIATVIAAGNNGYSDSMSAPACISSAVSVGSTKDGSNGATPADSISSFSNSAPFLTLLAPGEWITSSIPVASGSVSTYRGTSMAAPHVAGAFALLRSAAPAATMPQILTALTTTGASITDARNGVTKRRINVSEALAALAVQPAPTVTAIAPNSGPATGPIAVTISGTNFLAGTTAKLTKSGSSDIVGSNVQINSPIELTTAFDLGAAAAGAWNVVVTHPASAGGQSGVLPGGFTVTGAPVFTTHPSNVVAPLGGNAAFTAVAAGTPAPMLQWQVSADGGGSWMDLSNVPPYGGVTATTLTITGITANLDGRRYRAVATNTQGSATSNPATLTIGVAASGERVVLGFDDVPGAGGWMAVRGSRMENFTHRSWLRVPWTVYQQVGGPTHPAAGDVDGDGLDELVVGLGAGSGGGWLAVFDDAAHGFAFLRWIRVPWDEYNAANGETYPSAGDVDGDGRAEVVVGLGSGARGFFAIFDDALTNHRLLTWRQVQWSDYVLGTSGQTRPAVANVDGGTHSEIVIGLGRGSNGWLEVFDDAEAGFAHLTWIQVPWGAYNSANGETFPAAGDLDNDGRAELVIGLGPGGNGWLEVIEDAFSGLAHASWLWIGWPAYGAANGATHPAVGNFDADASREIVVGLGAYPGDGGWFQLRDDAASGYAVIGWRNVGFGALTTVGGGVWPAVGRFW